MLYTQICIYVFICSEYVCKYSAIVFIYHLFVDNAGIYEFPFVMNKVSEYLSIYLWYILLLLEHNLNYNGIPSAFYYSNQADYAFRLIFLQSE